MSIEHKDISDPNIHEPKGLSTAPAGTAYVATGTGAGSWERLARVAYGCMKCTSGLTTGITTAFKPVNAVSLGGSITWSENISSTEITVDSTSGYFQVTDAGIYEVNANVSFLAAINPSTFTFTLGVDSGAGIEEKSTSVQAILSTTKTAETSIVTMLCMPSLPANAKVYLLVKEAAGNEFTIQFCNMTISRVD